jgi:apolipoprotein N-acyltransferase
LAAPFAWVAVELARARITGFPWDLLGYSQVDNLLLTRLAPWTGVMGLSLVVAAVNALWLARIYVRRRTLAVGGMVLAGFFCVAAVVMEARWEPPLDVPNAQAVLVQDNLGVGAERGPQESVAQLLQSLDGWSERPEVESWSAAGGSYRPAAQGFHADVVLWPEAPANLIDNEYIFRHSMGQLAVAMDAPVIADSVAFGVARAAGEQPSMYNSASFFTATGVYAGRYNKMHLVPFGEYTPYKKLLFFAGHLLDNVGGFVPGKKRTMFTTGGHTYGVFICYESVFGDEVRKFALGGADVLVNLSDDGWYGDSSAPWEHLDMVRMRAIENDRWLLRSTNTGVTTVVDPYGRLGAALPRHVRGALLAVFAYVSAVTFYTRHGDWLGWICAVITAAFVLWAGWRSRSATGRMKAVH